MPSRTPGAHLAPALRQDGNGSGGNDPAPAPAGERDPERVRSMLSRFQSGQRAGRAVSSLPTDPSSDAPTDPRNQPPEEYR
jgi:hypothetical protein